MILVFYPSPGTDPNAMTNEYDHYDDDGRAGADELGPSKSQLKREASAAQKLGERLIELDRSVLQELDLPEKLVDAIELAQGIKSHGAMRRQRQYIGKLMRNMDTTEIQAVLEKLDQDSAAANRLLHAAERWRERLLDEGDAALAEFLDEFPQVDRQQLRQTVRAAQVERAKNRPPKHFRALFQQVRELLESRE